jgi:hypothetical protein
VGQPPSRSQPIAGSGGQVDEAAAAMRRAANLQEKIQPLENRKDLLKELSGHQERGTEILQDYLGRVPGYLQGSKFSADRGLLSGLTDEIGLNKMTLSELKNAPNPSEVVAKYMLRGEFEHLGLKETGNPSDDVLELTKALESKIQADTREAKVLADVLDKKMCEFYHVDSYEQVTDELRDRHFWDNYRRAMGDANLKRYNELIDMRLIPPSSNPTREIEGIDKRINEMRQQVQSAGDEAAKALPRPPTIGFAPKPNMGIGHQTRKS